MSKPVGMPVTSCDSPKATRKVSNATRKSRARILVRYRVCGSWRALAAEMGDEFVVSPGTLHRFATSDWEPKAEAVRAALGLPAVCPACGRVKRKAVPRQVAAGDGLPVGVFRRVGRMEVLWESRS